MDVNYEWFENLCASLSRNPVLATQTLEKFRESEVAVDARSEERRVGKECS